jgi:acyl transferase domain-containing protein
MKTRLRDFVEAHPELPAERIAYSSNLGRSSFPWRWSCVCGEATELSRVLRVASDDEHNVHATVSDPRAVFLFPGQGTRHQDMGRHFYRSERTFAEAIDACAALFGKEGLDLLRLLDMREDSDSRFTEAHGDTRNAQAALFAVGYALAKLWMSLGVAPAACIGHSIGEFVAAHLAGIFSLEATVRLVARRGELMRDSLPGAMTAVLSSEEDVRDCISDAVSVAAVNGPAQCVLSGATREIEKAEAKLEARGILCRRLATSRAFHSVLMDEAAREFTKAVAEVGCGLPKTPYVSTLTGRWIEPGEAASPEYWGRHLRHTVRFSDAVDTVLRDRHCIFIEVGPGHVLGGLARSALGARPDYAVVSSLAGASDASTQPAGILGPFAAYWRSGGRVDWDVFHDGRHWRLPLPAYPFQREAYPSRHATLTATFAPAPEPAGKGARTAASADARPTTTEETEQRPRDLVEVQVRALWQDLLGFDEIDPDADFLELGGHSLLAMQLAGRVRQTFGVMLSAGEIISCANTIKLMAGHLKQSGAG